MSSKILKTDKLCKTFSNGGVQHHILKNLDIEIYEGDYTVIMGASGAGKSTLLYTLSGMDKPTLGTIQFFHEELSVLTNDQLAVFRRKNCGFVFQQMYLLDNMTILDNIIVCGLLVGKDKKNISKSAKHMLKQVGLEEDIWNKFPSQLSGGETQRAATVRALINQPRIIFADEPTGALNSAAGTAVLNVLTEQNNNGQSIVMVTHDLKSARRGNRILYMKDGVIGGELNLGKYESSSKERHEKLQSFLNEMGW